MFVTMCVCVCSVVFIVLSSNRPAGRERVQGVHMEKVHYWVNITDGQTLALAK